MSGLAADFGGVIVKLVDRKQVSDTQLLGTVGTEIAQEGVFEALSKLVSHFEWLRVDCFKSWVAYAGQNTRVARCG